MRQNTITKKVPKCAMEEQGQGPRKEKVQPLFRRDQHWEPKLQAAKKVDKKRRSKASYREREEEKT